MIEGAFTAATPGPKGTHEACTVIVLSNLMGGHVTVDDVGAATPEGRPFNWVGRIPKTDIAQCTDWDQDELCDIDVDKDDDNDEALDEDDWDDNNPHECSDSDGDTCDDCASTIYDPSNDGDDYDMDGICDQGDTDDDNDECPDEDDIDDFNKWICGDQDGDTCDDCSTGRFDIDDDGWDYDKDQLCDDGDTDDDNDNVKDEEDSETNNEFKCQDADNDTCDECNSGHYEPPNNDGWDYDEDGICDQGDEDDDNDGALDENDSNDNDEFHCSDNDSDTCEDCISGYYLPNEDGYDYDEDGLCDQGDTDDDNDGVWDGSDSHPNNKYLCHDLDGDQCDECAEHGFVRSVDDEAWDYDHDGICDFSDTDDDNDNIPDEEDENPNNEFACMDTDIDLCDDCSSGKFDPANDGIDEDKDGACAVGDPNDLHWFHNQTHHSSPHVKGDPHVKNLRGEAFDIMQTGNMMLLEVPRASTPEALNLGLRADIDRLEVVNCGPTFITHVYMTGKWLGGSNLEIRSGPIGQIGATKTFGLRIDEGPWLDGKQYEKKGSVVLAQSNVTGLERPVWLQSGIREFKMAFDDLKVSVSQPKRPRIFLDVNVKGIGSIDGEVGGLLGIDDHEDAARLPRECRASSFTQMLGGGRAEVEVLEWKATSSL